MQGLKNILDNRFFIVPENQRGFSWGLDELRALKRDLDLAAQQKKNHYCGVLIARLDRDSEPVTAANYSISHRHFLEDGQQRLTTFLLLLLSIRDRLELFKDPDHTADLAELDHLLFYRDGSHKALRLFHTQRQLQDALSHLFVGGPQPAQLTAPVRALLEAHRWCREGVIAPLSANECLEWKNRITNQALLTLVDLNMQNLDPYLTFDAINSRGLPLGQFDKVKNFALLVSERRSITISPQSSWYAALEALEQHDATSRSIEEDFVAEMHSVFHGKRSQRDGIHKDFVDRYSELVTAPNVASQEMLAKYVQVWPTYAEAYGLIVASPEARAAAKGLTAQARAWLTRLDNLGMRAITRPVLVASVMKFDPNEFESIARACEMFTFRVYGVKGFRKDKASAELIYLAQAILHERVSAEGVLRHICWLLHELAPLESVIRELANGQPKYPFDPRVRGWEYLYYLLYEYEVSVSPRGVAPIGWAAERLEKVNTIEHVLPQSHRDGGWWQAHWPNELDAEAAKHRLGNLVLTGNNPALSRKPFPDKLNDTAGGYSYQAPTATNGEKRIGSFARSGTWTMESILLREAELLRFATDRWSIPCCSDDGEFQLPSEFQAHAIGPIKIGGRDCVPAERLRLAQVPEGPDDLLDNGDYA